jgi:hypothetical protein
VPYATADARRQLLDSLGAAADHLALALSELAEAYEELDELTADRLEEQLFSPLKLAYGRARRAHTAFAGRYELESRDFPSPGPGAPSRGAKGLIEDAVAAAGAGDQALADLQDSLLPVEVGDAPLRADLEQVRMLLDGFGAHARDLLRTLGR